MTFNHDVEDALNIVVDLVNTDPITSGCEALPDVTALRRFVEVHGLGDFAAAATDNDLGTVRDLRIRLRDVFLAVDTSAAATLVNELLHHARLLSRLTNHDGYGWHIHYAAPDRSVADHLLVNCGMALSFVLQAGEHERLQICTAPGCRRLLVDLSRNRSKRYCDSRTCGNRLHVAAYRERQRASTTV